MEDYSRLYERRNFPRVYNSNSDWSKDQKKEIHQYSVGASEFSKDMNLNKEENIINISNHEPGLNATDYTSEGADVFTKHTHTSSTKIFNYDPKKHYSKYPSGTWKNTIDLLVLILLLLLGVSIGVHVPIYIIRVLGINKTSKLSFNKVNSINVFFFLEGCNFHTY